MYVLSVTYVNVDVEDANVVSITNASYTAAFYHCCIRPYRVHLPVVLNRMSNNPNYDETLRAKKSEEVSYDRGRSITYICKDSVEIAMHVHKYYRHNCIAWMLSYSCICVYMYVFISTV